MNTTKYNQFVARWKETTELPPQRVGLLTGVYKRTTHRLKTMPMPTLIVISCLLVCVVAVLLGPFLASVVTMLQRGF